MTARGEAMLGRGGEIVHPASETATLTHIYGLLAEIIHGNRQSISAERAREALLLVEDLRRQVSQGYHRNPYKPFRIIGEMGSCVHGVTYTHAEDGKDYRHSFKGDNAQLFAIERHSKKDLLISSSRGVPLWDEF